MQSRGSGGTMYYIYDLVALSTGLNKYLLGLSKRDPYVATLLASLYGFRVLHSMSTAALSRIATGQSLRPIEDIITIWASHEYLIRREIANAHSQEADEMIEILQNFVNEIRELN